MLFKIAWKNIWRNQSRSWVVITAIALGLTAGVFASAFVAGMMNQRIDKVITQEISHFQFHAKDYRDEKPFTKYIENSDNIEAVLRTDSAVKAVSSRVITSAMIASANQSGGIMAVGIEPEKEAIVSKLSEQLEDGKYFEGIKRNPVLVSSRTAKKYGIKVRKKITLTFTDVVGETTSAAFRVVGIFNTHNGLFDEKTVFVRKSDLSRLGRLPDGAVHEIAVLQHGHQGAEANAKRYQEKYQDLEVLPWLDLGLGMRMMMESMGTYTTVLVGIILVALLFGILNTMLMAVLERTREIGMLMAVGMNQGKVFLLIMLETVLLAMVGGPIGLLFSKILIAYFGHTGISLAGAGYEEFGMASHIYPVLTNNEYIQILIMVAVMAVVAAIYPAIRALRLKPVEAFRK